MIDLLQYLSLSDAEEWARRGLQIISGGDDGGGVGGPDTGGGGLGSGGGYAGEGGYGTDTGGTGFGPGLSEVTANPEYFGGVSSTTTSSAPSVSGMTPAEAPTEANPFGGNPGTIGPGGGPSPEWLSQPNVVTPSFTNAQVVSFGQTPTGRLLGRIGLGLGALAFGPLAAAPGYLGSNFAVSGPGAPGHEAEGTLYSGPTATSAGASTITSSAGGTPTATTSDPLAALSGAVSSLFGGGPGGGGGGGAQLPERGLTYIPTTKTGSTLGVLLALAGLGGVGYWVYRRSKERH